jgi:hypothetical protein
MIHIYKDLKKVPAGLTNNSAVTKRQALMQEGKKAINTIFPPIVTGIKPLRKPWKRFTITNVPIVKAWLMRAVTYKSNIIALRKRLQRTCNTAVIIG